MLLLFGHRLLAGNHSVKVLYRISVYICHEIPIVYGLLKSKNQLIVHKRLIHRRGNLSSIIYIKIKITFLKKLIDHVRLCARTSS